MTLLQIQSRISGLLFLLLLFIVLPTAAQTDNSKFLPNITPPSPTAGELGKFGNVPVGLFTGAANLSIPLLSFKTKDLESPISLYYGSNGIKVDEVSSNVGLGWNLNFGGVITRTVRDKDDENTVPLYPPDDLAGATEAQRVAFYKAAGQESADTESDVYSFNFNGNSGKFVYDKNNQPVLVNNKKIKIGRTGINNADFVLTDTKGIKYFFTEKETTTFRSSGAGHSVISASVTAWYLSKIIHPNGSEIYLAYDNYTMEYVASNAQSLVMSYPQMQFSCNNSVYSTLPTLSGITASDMTVTGKKVAKIFSNNPIDGYITFGYHDPTTYTDIDGNIKIENITLVATVTDTIEKIKFDYLKTLNQRVFLQNITFRDPTKNYKFEYTSPTEFPKRLSFSQDHWGYYNGKENSNLVPKNVNEYDLNDLNYGGADKEPDGNFAKIGLLKKIFYPTKGYTEFDYESNTFWGEKTTYPSKTNIRFKRGENDLDEILKGGVFTSPIDQRIEFTGYVSYVKGPAPPLGPDGNPLPNPGDTGHYIASAQISNSAMPNEFLEIYTISDRGLRMNYTDYRFTPRQTNTFFFDAKAGQTYNFWLYKDGFNTSASINVNYYATAPTTINTNIATGGVRIKSTKDFSTEGVVPVYKRYYYGNKDDINRSSGNKGRTPLYVDLTMQRNPCPPGDGELGVACSYRDLTNLTLSSSSMISLFDTGSSNCFYKYVTVSEGGDAFENGGEMKEFAIRRDNFGQSLTGTNVKSAPFTNFGWDNGFEIRSQVFQKKVTGKPFVIIAETQSNYKLDPSYTNEIKGYSVRKDYNEICPNAQTVENLSIMEYKTKSYWSYLESTVSKSYDLNGLNPIETTTNYVYNNSAHLQLTSQSSKSSLAETLETKFYYPQDLPTEPLVADMIAANRIDTQLKIETFKAGTKMSEQKTVYAKDVTTGNLLQPKFIYAAKFPNILTNSLEKKITFDKYDDKGNILQYTPENSMPVAIIWGYDKTKPIAKVENITSYDQVFAAYNTNDTTFRTNLPSALITTFTYKPLVGVSTVTDPKGFTTTYHYDDFNRLVVVKDNLGNVVTENQYNYKN
ncbi:RHS repeat domain-containing protein [Flavobacterium poyangense]|uniref:RHS repeat domain-containing protein n=1 Tax=Flavobacterium poyangense TaxID=2204302 RepID=UPI00142318A6|nr:RHS repeat domain-containing protein [Flavobacterium sp. JXAS1]